jgi:response regulator RpfG family c-di-GMP phosphodiesterase
MARGAFLHDVESGSISFTDASEIVAAQHESYDGTGFPKCLKGEEIPLGILRVAYALDALLTGRPPLGGNVIPWVKTERRFYRAVSISEAKEKIQRASGALFDPNVVKVFLDIPDGIWLGLIQQVSEND